MPPHSVTTHAVVKFRRMSDEAILPTKATPGAAAYDLYAHRGGHLSEVHPYATVGTGIEIELPPGHVGLVCSRSGLAANQRLFVLNAPGIIDEDYRGEIKVILGMLPANAEWPRYDTVMIEPGMRIAQLIVMPLPAVATVAVSELSATLRGANGLGSTGT